MSYYEKYLKYKNKYLTLQKQLGGMKNIVKMNNNILIDDNNILIDNNNILINNNIINLLDDDYKYVFFEECKQNKNMSKILYQLETQTGIKEKDEIINNIIKYIYKNHNLNNIYIKLEKKSLYNFNIYEDIASNSIVITTGWLRKINDDKYVNIYFNNNTLKYKLENKDNNYFINSIINYINNNDILKSIYQKLPSKKDF